ncbi:DASH family cryptochrome [Pedobacter cryophilus]|uniref:Cryptochrome DASH n=1 Tax=Pedobacter cryophilus TaxID=2571271 RepID=A0A4U1CBE4_9SPHI|nr:DASH family cryptochrome [Pedobacter cryophilus]TKC01058.1 DASH family cryptochrome [Pedobacter cryophilus]
MSEKTILVWFRNDLRIHDNEILLEATQKAAIIVPVFCFDPRHFTQTVYHTQKTGGFRTQFLLESVADLKSSFQKMGGDLLIKIGKPEEIIPQICKAYKVDEVFHHREVASEETEVSSLTEDALWKLKINLKHFIGHTLYHKEDLPFPIKDIPDVFTSFRKKVERESIIKPSIATPNKIIVPQNLEESVIPTAQDLGIDISPKDSRSVLDFKGGETEGLKRLKYYLWDTNLLQKYKLTRNGLIGGDYSSKLSAWLTAGCLSPREIYWEIKKYEKERGANESTYWLIFELLWRDYFRFMFKKHSGTFFREGGFKGVKPEVAPNQQELFEKWKNGETGLPFIDANMKELNLTGFMSNRGRQNVASYLVKDLKVNWTWGAAYFEEKLIDYNPASNWGNWAYIAGVGNDPRENRYFNIPKQAKDYDPKAEYMKLWLPELGALKPEELHQKQ